MPGELRKEDPVNLKRGFEYMGIALVAGGIGAVLGLLMAPASGRETRRKVLRRVDEAKEDLVKSGERLVARVAERVEDEIKEVRRSIA
jgi:gas vesicle protein